MEFDSTDFSIVASLECDLSMSAAGVRLSLSTAAISKRIKRMEQVIGAAIFYRHGELKLTAAGLLLHELGKNVAKVQSNFARDLELLKSDHGELRIIAIASLLIDDLPIVLKKVVKRYPNLKINLCEGSADSIINSVRNNSAEVGLIGTVRSIDGLNFNPYRRERLCLFGGVNHPLAEVEPVMFSQAKNYQFVGMAGSNLMARIMEDFAKNNLFEINKSLTAMSLEVAAHMAAQSAFGICLTIESVAMRLQSAGIGKMIRLLDESAFMDIATCTRETAALSEPTLYFIAMLREHFSEKDRQLSLPF
ncbi:MAG: LysR family transcriptional regulator [Burkholderiaceae bacterium]|nr:LysR family transcriptional regulator [Burkholderiaceae bacterium]